MTPNLPPREAVIRIARQVSAQHGIVESLIFANRKRVGTNARRAAWAQILRETGCSMNGLGKVWGIDRAAILRGMRLLERGSV